MPQILRRFRSRTGILPATGRRVIIAALFAVTSAVAAVPASANHLGTRLIIVNGERLTPHEIVEADRAVGYRLPNGRYWWNPNNGYWGVVGGPPVGRVAPRRRQGYGGGGGRTPSRQFNTLIDSSGGCEGGSCVNIID